MRNKYPGICYKCGQTVLAGDGHFERKARGWIVIHAKCVFEQRAEKAERGRLEAMLKHSRKVMLQRQNKPR